MKIIVLYYSFTGHTSRIAKALAKELGADVAEVRECKKRGILGAFTAGAYAAIRMRGVPITVTPHVDCAAYDKAIIAMPVWAGMPAPAYHSVLDMLPSGMQLELLMVSGSGDTSRTVEKIQKYTVDRGFIVAKYADVKSGR